MTSIRETALLALFNRLKEITGPLVQRNEVYPERIPPGGLIALEDGEPGEPEVTLSPTIYHYQHPAQIICAVQKIKSEDRDVLMDDLLQRIGDAITASDTDTTLGGAVEHLEMSAPDAVSPSAIEGAEGIKAIVTPVILFYSTSRPL